MGSAAALLELEPSRRRREGSASASPGASERVPILSRRARKSSIPLAVVGDQALEPGTGCAGGEPPGARRGRGEPPRIAPHQIVASRVAPTTARPIEVIT